ncbi:cytochrome P450 [Didymella exigua CBS 183.55]|uniref:Cytochrome P450 n=1 Tax=Didymella exigua CBS 183.55 TaxID=1150837 RepID=A0A6A5RCH1_9PLEO|nr:cytochrome P450 [Didymella exigua CBS 183.55]KAF1925079.1 cytochrome P450 [Didymella exigua CBS 183.55]
MELTGAPTDTSSPLLSIFIHQNVFVHVLLAFAAICVCTRLISGYRFNVIKDCRTAGITPPTLPHWLPGLRHALHMAYSASQFVARSLDTYGDGTPFFVDAAGEKILILLDPKHVKKALASPDLDANIFVHNKIMGQLMGSPQAAIDYYRTPGHTMNEEAMLQIRTHTTGSQLISMDQKLLEIFERNLSKLLPSAHQEGWMDIPDLYTFFKLQGTLAVGETILGTAIHESYPRIAEDLWTFIEGTDILLLGLPRCFAPKSHGARDRLLKHIKTWGRKSDALREKNAVNKDWDAIAGSTLMQEREQMYSALPGHDDDGRAAQTLGLLYGGTSLSVPVTFWFLYEILRDPALHKKVFDELHLHSAAVPATTDFAGLATSPFLQSLHAEAVRFYTRNVAAREVVAPIFQLDDRYVVEKGVTVLIPNGNTARFTQEWSRSRPQAIKQPLTQFWPERFLVRDGKSERYNESGLSGNWTSFGGGEHRCPGRFFARDIALVALTLFLGKYEVQIVDPEGARRFDPVWNEIAFGTMTPKGKIGARIRLRKA